MTALKAGEVEAFLRRPDPRYPLVLIYGPDHGLVSERARFLARSAVENPDDPFQLIRMDGDQLASDPMRLVDEAHTVPMFGGKRSIWVRMGSNPLAEAIGQLCSVPPRDVLIVLEAGELTPKSPLRSLIEKASTAAALPCFGDEGRSLGDLVDQGLKQYGLQIDRDAKEVLIERLGADRLMSRNEIDKLALYVSGRPRITLADVDAMMADTGTVNLDQLIDAVFVGASGNADEMLRRCLAEHMDAGVIVGAMPCNYNNHGLCLIKARIWPRSVRPRACISSGRMPMSSRSATGSAKRSIRLLRICSRPRQWPAKPPLWAKASCHAAVCNYRWRPDGAARV